jgi:hypothetical protein
MNKKLNTFFFIILATVFNIVIIMVLMIAFVLIVGYLVPKTTPKIILNIIITALFIGTLIAAFFIYHIIVSALDKKFDLEKYLLPVFRTKKKNDSDSNKILY